MTVIAQQCFFFVARLSVCPSVQPSVCLPAFRSLNPVTIFGRQLSLSRRALISRSRGSVASSPLSLLMFSPSLPPSLLLLVLCLHSFVFSLPFSLRFYWFFVYSFHRLIFFLFHSFLSVCIFFSSILSSFLPPFL